MDHYHEEKMVTMRPKPLSFFNRIGNIWNEHIMERFIKTNLFVICCIAAVLLMVAYLAAFSCEVSWLLEAHGDLPVSSYVLCTQYFMVFVATTILMHGLVTGLSWGLFAWSVIIGILSIPELAFVMIMTTQYWGLQSVHGMTELISYLIRLVINCFALICIIPTGLRWRRESQVRTQLEALATRLQLQTPPPSAPPTKTEIRRGGSCRNRWSDPHQGNSFDNSGFIVNEQQRNMFGSQNEFTASLFATPQSNYFAEFSSSLVEANSKRAQSLMDLRCTLPGMYNARYVLGSDDIDSTFINSSPLDKNSNNVEIERNISKKERRQSMNNDPIYCTIEPKVNKNSRNCVSLENLDMVTKIMNDQRYGRNLLQNCQQYYNNCAAMGYPIGYQSQNYTPLQIEMIHQHFHTPQKKHNFNAHQYHHQMPQHNSNRIEHQHEFYPPLQYYKHWENRTVGCGGVGYGGFTNPYAAGCGAASKQSLANISDDYRKYRDVAL